MAIGIYAGSTAGGVTLLPSPVDVQVSNEIIWSEDTGRAQSGTNKAKMIGSVVAEKRTYSIKWGVLQESELNAIRNKLTAGFFFFAMASSLSSARSSATKCYRSEINYDVLPVGSTTYYKNVAVSVIEQ